MKTAMPQGHSHGATELKLLPLNEVVFPRKGGAKAPIAE